MLLGTAGVDPLLPTAGGITVEIDWAKDGTFSAYGDNVTSYVRSTDGVTVGYGRDQTTALSPSVAGQGSFTLKNGDRRFSPRNTDSPLYGSLKPARPVRITRTIGSTVYGLFNGHTDDTPINPDRNSQSVSVSMMDYLADFRGQTVSTQLHRDIRTGTAIGYILDACGWDADLRDIDPGATVIPWWWEDGTDALDAMEKIVRSEGPPALLSVGGSGEIVFRDRHHRLTRTASLSSQGTWYSTPPAEPVMHKDGFVFDEAWRNIINTGSITVDVRQPGEVTAVWTSDATLTLSAGEQRIVSVVATDPFYNALTPVAGTDYQLTTGSVSVRLITTSGLSTGIEFTAGGSGAVLSALQLRANPVTVAYTVQISASDPASVEEYGPRSFPTDLPWCGPGDAQAVLDLAVGMRSQPLPIVQCRFVLEHSKPDKSHALLVRDLSDRITLIDPETGESVEFYVESIQHEFRDVYDHSIAFGLEAVPAQTETLFRFDVAGAGFNQGVFSRGLVQADSMFRFDDAAHGFNLGQFSQ